MIPAELELFMYLKSLASSLRLSPFGIVLNGAGSSSCFSSTCTPWSRLKSSAVDSSRRLTVQVESSALAVFLQWLLQGTMAIPIISQPRWYSSLSLLFSGWVNNALHSGPSFNVINSIPQHHFFGSVLMNVLLNLFHLPRTEISDLISVVLKINFCG